MLGRSNHVTGVMYFLHVFSIYLEHIYLTFHMSTGDPAHIVILHYYFQLSYSSKYSILQYSFLMAQGILA